MYKAYLNDSVDRRSDMIFLACLSLKKAEFLQVSLSRSNRIPIVIDTLLEETMEY